MSLTVNVKTDIAEALARLSKLEPRQFPFIVALAMNRTMKVIKQDLRDEMAKVFDRPAPFTLNALATNAAKKESLEASVRLREFAGKGVPASKYLVPQIYAGPRKHKRFEIALIRAGVMPPDLFAVPGQSAPLDNYGNLRGSYITQILSYLKAFGEQGYVANRTARSTARRKAQFFAVNPQNQRTAGLPYGIYQRTGDNIKLVIAFVKQPTYRKRFDFYGVAEKDARKLLAVELQKAGEYAISTSRANITASDIARAIGSLGGA